jgi:multidrug transporter EmrE-like cation transporter
LIWLLPAAACSILIAVILKINEGRGGDRLLMVGANYIVASLLALMLMGGRPGTPSAAALGLGAVTGIDYVLAILVLMTGISRGPLAVPVTVMRLSVAVPVVASIFLWSEKPSAAQWGGIALGIAAIALFGMGISSRSGGAGAKKGFWPLMLAIFILTGLASILLKTFSDISSGPESLQFTWILFTFAGIFTWIIIRSMKIPFNRKTFLFGMLLGVPNLFSTVFTLRALEAVPASIVFPFINVTVIFGATVLGFFVWKESLGGRAIAGLVLAAAALVLLPL